MKLEQLNAACLARRARLTRDRRWATLATVVAFATVGAITAAGNPLQAPSPEVRRAALCGLLMTRASEAQAAVARLRAAKAMHDNGRRNDITAADSEAASARAEYNAVCK